jgi:hypothetical protein
MRFLSLAESRVLCGLGGSAGELGAVLCDDWEQFRVLDISKVPVVARHPEMLSELGP